MTRNVLNGDHMVLTAREFATLKHADQLDKAGRPYISHPARVAARVGAASYGPGYIAVAWLHDVIEDQDVTPEQLREHGFPEDVVAGVVAMTKLGNDDGDDAIERACAHPIALVVKAADVADNTDPSRVALLTHEQQHRFGAKYGRYREVLDRHRAPTFPETMDSPAAP